MFSSQNITLDQNDGFVIRAVLYDANGAAVTPTAILLPDKLRQISNPNYGDASIKNVSEINSCSLGDCYQTFAVTLTASKLVPILWIDIKQEVKDKNQLLYWFSDNGFTMTESEVTVDLKIFSTNASILSITAQDLIVGRLKMNSNATCPPNWSPSNINNKNCYYVGSNSLSWTQANNACSSQVTGATLLSIDNAFENNEVTSLIPTSCAQTYIGLHKTSDWTWVNGDPSTYRNWESGIF